MRTSIINADKVGWRVNEWGDDVGIGRAYVYELLNKGEISSVKIGGARIITTPPADYIRRCAQRANESITEQAIVEPVHAFTDRSTKDDLSVRSAAKS